MPQGPVCSPGLIYKSLEHVPHILHFPYVFLRLHKFNFKIIGHRRAFIFFWGRTDSWGTVLLEKLIVTKVIIFPLLWKWIFVTAFPRIFHLIPSWDISIYMCVNECIFKYLTSLYWNILCTDQNNINTNKYWRWTHVNSREIFTYEATYFQPYVENMLLFVTSVAINHGVQITI